MTFFKTFYRWIMKTSQGPYASPLLTAVAFTESSFFPVPPEVILLPMCFSRPKRAYLFALNCTISSVAGGVFGYFLGRFFWGQLQDVFFQWVPGLEKYFSYVGQLFLEHGGTVIFIAAFTIVPYKVFTLAAGVYSAHVSLPLLIIGSLLGRGIRYMGLAFIVKYLGEKAPHFIEKNFTLITSLIGLVVVIAIVIIKLLG